MFSLVEIVFLNDSKVAQTILPIELWLNKSKFKCKKWCTRISLGFVNISKTVVSMLSSSIIRNTTWIDYPYDSELGK